MSQTTTSFEAIRRSNAAAINRAEAAAALGVDPRTISAAIKDGTIPAIRLGRRILIPREKFIALFEAAYCSRSSRRTRRSPSSC